MRAAIFDMDGTLIDSLIFWDLLWSAIGKKYLNDPAFRPDETTDRECRTVTVQRAMELVHERFGAGESASALLDFTNAMIDDFYRNTVQLKPGVLEFLEHLKARNVRMCVATASATDLVKVALANCGIDGYFDALFSCADIGKGKEHPDVYLHALRHLGTTVEETWVFEDSYVALHTACGIGMPTVGLFDPNNFDQDKLKAEAAHYIAEGETVSRLIGLI